MPSDEEVTEFALFEVKRIINDRKEIFMELMFDSMQTNSGSKVYRTDFENWFMVKIPKVNNHERMKILGILNKEFKAHDSKKKGYLELAEFNLMKDFIIKFFMVFNHYKMMDEAGNGQVV